MSRLTALTPLTWVLPLLLGSSGCATRHAVHNTGVHTFSREYSNAHVLLGPRGFVMIDAGLEREGPQLATDLQAHGLDPARLEAVILTHGHADHAGGARYFQQRYGTKIIVGAGDVEMLATGRNDALCPTDATARRRLAADQAATYTPVTPDIVVDGELDLGTVTSVQGFVQSLPGHTDGSLVVLAGSAAFVGDLFRGAIGGRGARRHFYMCDLVDNDRDIEQLLRSTAERTTVFFPGHFGPVSRRRVKAYFGREAQARSRARTAASP